jgi:hypothetical protein
MSCETNFCDKVYVPRETKIMNKLSAKLFNNSKFKQTKKLRKDDAKRLTNSIKKECLKKFCNPGCKDTFFSNSQTFRNLEPNIIKQLDNFKIEKLSAKDKKAALKQAKLLFNTLRRKYKNPLKNNFYQGLRQSVVKTLKNKGAKSGCVEYY